MTKNFGVKAGYYEWNILCNGKMIDSISNGFEECVKENPKIDGWKLSIS